MQSFSSALLLACLHGSLQLQLASARRLSSRPGQSLSESASSAHTQRQIRKESWKYEGEEEPVQKCVYAEDLVLQCPEAGQRVGIVTAFWNRRKRTGCRGEDRDFKAGLHCNPNATEKVIELCRGQQGASCTVPKGFTGCEENPFTYMRVRWHCQGQEAVVADELALEKGDSEELPAVPTVAPAVATTEAPTPAPAPWEFQTKPKPVDETDKEVKDWKETPDRRLRVSNLKKEHCNGLEVGSWPKVGQTGCELETGVSTLSPSPHFNEDAVCRCHFLTPGQAPPHLGGDCDKIFPKADTVYKVSDKRSKRGKGRRGKKATAEGNIAIFGKEGCYCHPDEKSGWTLCDLAVKEV